MARPRGLDDNLRLNRGVCLEVAWRFVVRCRFDAADLMEPQRNDSRLRVEGHHSPRFRPGNPEDHATGPALAAPSEGPAPGGTRSTPDRRRRGAALHTPEGARATYRRVRRPRPTTDAAVDPLTPRATADAADRVRQTRRREPRIHLRMGDRPHVAPRPQRGPATRSAEDGPPQGAQRSRLWPPSRKGPEGSTPLTQLPAFRSKGTNSRAVFSAG